MKKLGKEQENYQCKRCNKIMGKNSISKHAYIYKGNIFTKCKKV